ncbi:MAG: HD domain-containing protein, partial [Bacteroidota bacterium]
MEATLLKQVETRAMDLLAHKLDKNYTYHNLGHTQQVVQAVAEIGSHSGLKEEEILLLKIAAWFHDLGYMQRYVGHEEDSIKMARAFLGEIGAPPATITEVEKLIEATILDLEPRSLLEQIIKDADLYNLAMPHAIEHSEEIRHEWKVFCDRNFTDEEWDVFNYDFFREHSY